MLGNFETSFKIQSTDIGYCNHLSEPSRQPVMPYLEHADEGSDGSHGVKGQFADVDFHDGQVPEFRPRDEHKEQNEGDNSEHQHQDPYEQTLMRACAVHRVVVRVTFVRRLRRQTRTTDARTSCSLRCRRATDVLPHDVEDGGADQRVFDGAGEQEGAGVLHQGAHDVGASALVDMVWSLEATRHAVVRL